MTAAADIAEFEARFAEFRHATGALRFMATNLPVALAGLLRMLEGETEATRWKAAAYLLLLDPSHTGTVEQLLKGQARAPSALREFGFELENGNIRRLWPEALYHLVFPPGYLERERTRPQSVKTSAPAPSVAFGGFVEGLTPEGRKVPLDHVITLDPVPPGLGVSLPRLVLATHLEALQDDAELFQDHHADGTVHIDESRLDWDEDTEAMVAEVPVLPQPLSRSHPAIVPTRIELVRTTGDEVFQDWGSRARGENLFRLGGLPVFVQGYSKRCVLCKRPMMHLLSLDSGLPLEGPDPNGSTTLDWGSGGVANVCWCDGCRVSAWSWSCS